MINRGNPDKAAVICCPPARYSVCVCVCVRVVFFQRARAHASPPLLRDHMTAPFIQPPVARRSKARVDATEERVQEEEPENVTGNR